MGGQGQPSKASPWLWEAGNRGECSRVGSTSCRPVVLAESSVLGELPRVRDPALQRVRGGRTWQKPRCWAWGTRSEEVYTQPSRANWTVLDSEPPWGPAGHIGGQVDCYSLQGQAQIPSVGNTPPQWVRGPLAMQPD